MRNNPFFAGGICLTVRLRVKGGSPDVTDRLRCLVSSLISCISCIVIKTDRFSRKIPTLGDIVRVADRDELFVVMDVDHERRIAQVMERNGEHHLIDVPFPALRTFNRNLARAIHRFLDANEGAEAAGIAAEKT